MNKLAKIGIIGGLTLGAAWLMKLQIMSNKLITKLSNPRIQKVDQSGIVFRTEIELRNPTKNGMTITKPVVSISTDGEYITGNKPESKTYIIKPLSPLTIDTIEIVIPWLNLVKYASGILFKSSKIIAAYKANKKDEILSLLAIPLEIKYSLYADGLFYESKPQKIE